MITRLTKIQLVIFAIVTLLGGAFVGGRYAQIDRLVTDRSFPVNVQLKDSGGLFAGAQVTYRGIGVGRVGKMTFKDDGVRARLDIENSAPKIPADLFALVANKSAVGEQFIDLQPRTKSAPFLKRGSFISEINTQIPLDTATVLIDVNDFVTSIDTKSLKTMVDELGTAFQGTGPDLGRIIDTTTEFITTANDNIGVTRALIQDSGSVLQTQIDKKSELKTFAKNLALLSDTFVSSDPDLRRLLAGGGPSANALRQVIAENSNDLGKLFNNLITANRPLYKNVGGLHGILILYPYVVEGAFTVAAKGPDGHYDAAFGAVLTDMPAVCHEGYNSPVRAPDDLSERQFDITSDCLDKNLVARNPSKTVINRAPVAVYDPATGALTPTTTDATESSFELPDSQAFGKDSWKWLLLGPAASK